MSSDDRHSSFFFLGIIVIGLLISFILTGNLSGKYNKLSDDYDNLQAEYDLLEEKYNSLEDDLCIVWRYFYDDAAYDDAREAVNRLDENYFSR